jgi:hypothetical protein
LPKPVDVPVIRKMRGMVVVMVVVVVVVNKGVREGWVSGDD